MRMPPRTIVLSLVLAAGAFYALATAVHAYRVNGTNGFPLDDPWIHLQFARNLHDYGSFSYYHGETVTSGSTSPLYTLLLALAFFISSNEMIISYVAGIVFTLLGAVFLFALAEKKFGHGILLAGIAAFLFVSDPRILWITLSGMETTFFIALTLASIYFYHQRSRIMFGVIAGVLVWARPEGVIVLAVVAVDAIYHAFLVRRPTGKKQSPPREDVAWLRRPLLIIAMLVAAYVGWNLMLSGTLLPNTYAAKVKYYAGGGSEFPAQVYAYFTKGHMQVVAGLVAVAFLASVVQAMRRKPVPLLIPLGISLGMFLAYWQYLPYLFQEGRYLMPVIPFVLLLGVGGADTLADLMPRISRSRSTSGTGIVPRTAFLLVPLLQFAYAGWEKKSVYAEYCDYITQRQVRTASWIRDHLPPDARVATHDVGAIAYYSGRRIVDMVGLISPEMVAHIGNLDGLVQFMQSKGVTHLAVLRNWFEIDNEFPLFQTDENYPEIMEVFPFHPERIHFLPRTVGQLLDAGSYYMMNGDPTTATQLFAQAVRDDPRSAKCHRLFAGALLQLGKMQEAEQEYRTALRFSPSDIIARTGLARVDVARQNIPSAIAQVESIVKDSPQYAEGYRLLSELYASQKDSSRASIYAEKAKALSPEGVP